MIQENFSINKSLIKKIFHKNFNNNEKIITEILNEINKINIFLRLFFHQILLIIIGNNGNAQGAKIVKIQDINERKYICNNSK
jgi:hypothetical protein